MSASRVKRVGVPILGWWRSPLAAPSIRWARLANRAGCRLIAALRAALPDVLTVLFLALATLFLFRDALADGLIFHEPDTSTMFYPIFAALNAALGRGELLLWSPHLFSGFPLLAEGQTGVLYAPNLLAALLLPVDQGFIWLRIAHYSLAIAFTYLFARILRLSPGPSAVAALSFSFGSFMVGQMQHASVVASAIWLPLVLSFSELALRGRGRVRLRWAALAGLAMGTSALGVHMQPVILSGGCFVGWVIFRTIFPAGSTTSDLADGKREASRSPLRAWCSARARARLLSTSGRRPWSWIKNSGGAIWRSAHESGGQLIRLSRAAVGRLSLAVWISVLVPVLACAIAAAQLLPLYELSQHSGRAHIWTYELATDYSLPLSNLMSLLFPFFFRQDHERAWSLWQPWEVTYYAGVVPLALAVLALAAVRRREVLFFATLVLVVTLLALGDYSPINVYAQVWDLPGFNLQRAPARFTYLGVFGLAMLAALGSQVLWESLRTWPSGARPTLRVLVLWLVGLVVLLTVLVWHLVTWRAWLQAEPLWALEWIDQAYLSLRRDPGVVDSAKSVYAGLWHSLDLVNPHTALPLLLLAALILLVFCWNEFRRPRVVWQALLLLLVAADLLTFAHAFHPLVSMEEVADTGAVGPFLAGQPGQFRIFTDPLVSHPRANQLLPWEVSEVRAYDPLELSRHRVFLGTVSHVDNWLIDLLGVRFRLLPTDTPGLPSYRQTGFHPQHPLVSGTAGNPSGHEVWTVPGSPADELRVISTLEDAYGIGEGEIVAEWILTSLDGREYRFPMLAGRDTAEWTIDDPGHAVRPAHQRARVAFTFDLPYPKATGASQVHLFYASYPVPGRPRITRAEFRYLHPTGKMQVYGFGFFDSQEGHVAQFFDREKYSVRLLDDNVLIQENQAVFPRAFAVPEAVLASSAEDALLRLAEGPIQPRRQVVLEDASAVANFEPNQVSGSAVSHNDRFGEPYGDVEILDYRSDTVQVRADTDGGYLILADAYYPGWKAFVNGQETPILRADYLFRAVSLPAGVHIVEFRYMPASFETGMAISRVGLLFVGLALLASLVPAPGLPRLSWRRRP